MKTDRTVLLAALIFVAGLVLTIFALLSPNAMRGASSGMMGGTNDVNSYSITSMLLAMVGSFMMAIGVFLAFFRQEYEPLTDIPSIQHANTPFAPSLEYVQPQIVTSDQPAAEVQAQSTPPAVDDRILVLRLLTGDERSLFRAIVESGGEALQKDLMVKANMSDAKVSRTLDKLVEKGVVSKSRFGMTNKVKVEIEP
ncbi:MAG TPA: hypothetical protein VGK23_00060 [Methanomassiliicoccales archaeon]|jgi:preprotein translocase subunit SecG